MSLVRDHFEKESGRYDEWKRRNRRYYDTLKGICGGLVPRGASVLEVGCGTGDILAHVRPRRGVGADISPAMIERAKRKHPEYEWLAVPVERLPSALDETFDVVILCDVIEHLEDRSGAFRAIRRLCRDGTRLIVTMANPLWEPVLMLLEKLRLKMPEGPHERISARALTALLARHGFVLRGHSRRLLFPASVPILSAFFDAVERLPLIRRLCLIEVLEYRYEGK